MNNNNERIEIINNTAFIKGDYKGDYSEWMIEEEADGGVSIGCEHSDGHDYLFLNQTELKQLIEFLQTKIK
jgi:hypothetical protein